MTENGTEKKPRLGAGTKSFLFLLAFALLGAYTGMQAILAFRSIFSESLSIMAARLFWLGLGVWAAFYCFRKFRPVRDGLGPTASDLLFYLAWALFLAGFLGYRLQYRSPAAKLDDEMEAERLDCRNHAAASLLVSGPSDSHTPGSGYIKVKATFTARTRLVLQGGGWLGNNMESGATFSAELPRTELEPGKPKELTFYLLVNPEYDGSSQALRDGPYRIPEITAYVYDPAVTAHWGTWAGEVSCKAPVIRNYTTGPYKAAEMGRVKWRYEGDYDFLPPGVPKPGRTAPAAKPADK